jgi:hypothetical protein
LVEIPPPVLRGSTALLAVLEAKQRNGELPRWRGGDQDWIDRTMKLQIIFGAPPDPIILTQVVKEAR